MRTKPLYSTTTSKHKYPAPLILPAQREDIPRLVEIYMLAEERDLITIIENNDDSLITKWLIDLLEKQFDSPELRLMKAVDAESGEITALAFWWLRGYGLEKEKGGEVDVVHDGIGRDGQKKNKGLPFLFPPMLIEPKQDAIETAAKIKASPLQKHISAAFSAFEKSWIVGTKCMTLSLLMTDPHYQRRGIGTALLEWGHERADREGVPCFLIASPAGHPLYAHVGWKVIGEPMEVNLKDWAEYASGGDMGWGVYRFYYMLRLPKDGKSL